MMPCAESRFDGKLATCTLIPHFAACIHAELEPPRKYNHPFPLSLNLHLRKRTLRLKPDLVAGTTCGSESLFFSLWPSELKDCCRNRPATRLFPNKTHVGCGISGALMSCLSKERGWRVVPSLAQTQRKGHHPRHTVRSRCCSRGPPVSCRGDFERLMHCDVRVKTR